MADKDFKVKNGIDLAVPLPIVEGGTGQTSATNAFNALLPAQTGHANKFLQSDGTNTSWAIPAKGLNSGTLAQRPGSASNGDLYFNTDDMEIEVYQNGNWLIANITPGSPTGVTATNQGTGRAFNDGQASIAFTAATSGGPVKTFTVTPTPTTSPATFSGSSSPITVTNLASSTQYTYTVTASSNIGTSAASAASAGVTATTVPQAPTIGTATSSDSQQASVTFTAGSTGGAAISSYTVTSSPGNITASGASSPITVTGLTNGTSYTFTVTATNSNGTSSSSAASNSVTPILGDPGNLIPIAAITLSSAEAFIEFTNIPSTYTHLQIRGIARGTYNTGNDAISAKLNFNSDTTVNYATYYTQGYSGVTTSISSGGGGTGAGYDSIRFGVYPKANWTSNIYGTIVSDILHYSSTNKYKTVRNISGAEGNSSAVYQYVELESGVWLNTNAITSLKITPINGNFDANSSFALYGVKV